MSVLERVRRYIVPRAVVGATNRHLRQAGILRAECFVLWSGIQEGEMFYVRSEHLPRQTAYRLDSGLCVRVEGEELHRLNVWLFEHNELLAVQVHSHPTDAYHSETDDTYPIVTIRGGLSLVVPNFAEEGLFGEGVAYYRLGLSGWDELSEKQAKEIIEIRD
jgi:hypothetical protein